MIRTLVVLAVLAVGGAGAVLAPHSEPAGPGEVAPVARIQVPRAQGLSEGPTGVLTRVATPAKPLAGIRIALDPGHQLGNHNFPRQINRPVPAGGFTKPCNTTGTATDSGYPEATVNFAIAKLVKARLEALGATVLMTRTSNSQKLWGPCVDKRGEFGKKVHAVLTVSLHADGAPASDHGFHVIAPTRRKPWTTDIAAASLRLAKALRSGLDGEHLARSNYIGGGTALNIRSDLGTLNMSDVPVAMIEIGNMRNAGDAKRMKAASGRATYAAAVVAGIRKYLGK